MVDSLPRRTEDDEEEEEEEEDDDDSSSEDYHESSDGQDDDDDDEDDDDDDDEEYDEDDGPSRRSASQRTRARTRQRRVVDSSDGDDSDDSDGDYYYEGRRRRTRRARTRGTKYNLRGTEADSTSSSSNNSSNSSESEGAGRTTQSPSPTRRYNTRQRAVPIHTLLWRKPPTLILQQREEILADGGRAFDINLVPVPCCAAWLARSTPDAYNTYRPQVGDLVTYFWQGHRAYAEQYPTPFAHLPYQRAVLSPHIKCRVAAVRYIDGPVPHCSLDLAPLSQAARHVDLTNIHYHETALPPFVVPTRLVDQSRNRWTLGDRFKMTFFMESDAAANADDSSDVAAATHAPPREYHGSVVEVSPMEDTARDSEWQSVAITWFAVFPRLFSPPPSRLSSPVCTCAQ